MIDEGYIKFDCRWSDGPPPPIEAIVPLMRWRDRLHELGLIGVYPDGIGFGNASIRCPEGARGEELIISGTQTGGIPRLGAEGYTVVTAFDIERNTLWCRGPVRASSESLTHAAIYRAVPDAGAVLHVHHLAAWEGLLGRLPTTRADVPYGTPAMAHEIARLIRESDLLQTRVAVMAGHCEGIVAFGADPDEAGAVLLATVEEWTVGRGSWAIRG
jgi:ribulose-5-phosphate 4-epimerase/fuculose-1-phosphate aldolase